MTPDEQLGRLDNLAWHLNEAKRVAAELAAFYGENGDKHKFEDADDIRDLTQDALTMADEMRTVVFGEMEALRAEEA